VEFWVENCGLIYVDLNHDWAFQTLVQKPAERTTIFVFVALWNQQPVARF
jgi:hypothetical protein